MEITVQVIVSVFSTKILKITVSFGSCNSLVELPTAMSHASIDPELCKVPKDLVRLSIGIEDVRDVIDDIDQALKFALELEEEEVMAGEEGENGRFDSKFEELPRTPAAPAR